MDENSNPFEEGQIVKSTPTQLDTNPLNGNIITDQFKHGKGKKYIRFTLAALSSVPWVGSYFGVASAVAGLKAEFEQEKDNELIDAWLKEHEVKIQELGSALYDIYSRLDGFGEGIRQRLESEEYLTLVRVSFRAWDQAETKDKKEMVKKLIINAGAIHLCSDDLVRLFIKWIEEYHESHFMIIKAIYQNPSITRGAMWDRGNTKRPQENSPEADLFRYLIRDLSTGGVIRQQRDTNARGEFMKSPQTRSSSGSAARIMESAFEDSKPYVLTELGKQFVHYVMTDVVKQIDS